MNKDWKCKDCIYFDKLPVQKRTDDIIGSCKANPPSPAKEESKSNLGEWPLVLGSFGCGIFEYDSTLKEKE